MRLELYIREEIHPVRGFQFHKGAIRTTKAIIDNLQYGDFNSIKVRLEPASLAYSLELKRHFNSIKVRLELYPASSDNLLSCISIP